MSLLLLLSCGFFLWQPTVIFLQQNTLPLSSPFQAGRGGVDRKPLTIESLRKTFENSCVDDDYVQNPFYNKAK